MRAAIDRVLRFIAKAAMFGWFRRIEVEAIERVPLEGPVIVVAPHFNGFVDPALLAATLPRMPRFLAMARLWTVPGLKPLLAFAGAVPVYRSSEGSTAGNVGTFDACHRVLREGGAIALFPEGRVNDRFRLLPLKTGAARIALGARAAGARGVRIVPVGTIFEDRSAIRSRAVVRVGDAIVLDDRIAALTMPGEPEGDANRAAVERLTDEVRGRLRAVTVDFDDADRAQTLALAARVAIRDPEAPPWIEIPLGEAWALAERIEHAPAPARTGVVVAANRYRAHLDLLGLDDRDVVPGNTPDRFRRRYDVRAARALAAAPFAVVGAIVNAAPAALVHLAGRRVPTKVGQATPKLLSSLALFPVTWLAWALWFRARRLAHPWLGAIATGPACGWATLYAFERYQRNRRDAIAWRRLRRSASALEELRAQREVVCEAVGSAFAERSATDPPRT
jgi:glycerol-3-phosphate O-acyltransferase/dihydroxyacetone phosphate acyltransferase